jgi:hypothetical protein
LDYGAHEDTLAKSIQQSALSSQPKKLGGNGRKNRKEVGNPEFPLLCARRVLCGEWLG